MHIEDELETLELKLRSQRSLSNIRDMRSEIKKTLSQIEELKSRKA